MRRAAKSAWLPRRPRSRAETGAISVLPYGKPHLWGADCPTDKCQFAQEP